MNRNMDLALKSPLDSTMDKFTKRFWVTPSGSCAFRDVLGNSNSLTSSLIETGESSTNSTSKQRVMNSFWWTSSSLLHPEWEQELFVIANENDAVCLICRKMIYSPTEWNVKRHYLRNHAKDFDNLDGENRIWMARSLKRDLSEYQITTATEEESAPAVVVPPSHVAASYEVALRIAKTGKPFTDGPFVKDCLLAAAHAICPAHVLNFERISVSPRDVGRRVLEMDDDVKKQLRQKINSFIACSMAIEESTNIADVPQLAMFIRGVDDKLNVTEELLEICPLKGRTTGPAMLDAVVACFSAMEVPWEIIKSFCTDGTAAMTGKNSPFSSLLAGKVYGDLGQSDVEFIYCIIHQEVLFAEKVDTDQVLPVVVKAVNFIRTHAVSNRHFKPFMENTASEPRDIPLHSAVKWLIQGHFLKRFFEIRAEVQAFMIVNDQPITELDTADWVASLAFLIDLISRLNTFYERLQRKDQLAHKMLEAVKTFQNDLTVWRENLAVRNFADFPTLESLPVTKRGNVASFSSTLENLHSEFNSRFLPYSNMQTDFDIFSDPFGVDVSKAPAYLRIELDALKTDANLTRIRCVAPSLDGLCRVVKQNKYPLLHALAAKVLCLFGSTHICEQFLSNLNASKNKNKTRLTDELVKATTRLAVLQDLKPDMPTLVKKCET